MDISCAVSLTPEKVGVVPVAPTAMHSVAFQQLHLSSAEGADALLGIESRDLLSAQITMLSFD